MNAALPLRRLATAARRTHPHTHPHTHTRRLFSTSPSPAMKVLPVPVRDDNYAYVVLDPSSGSSVFVDPYTLSTVRTALSSAGFSESKVQGCITTHHHHDHSGGNDDFRTAFPGKPIWAGSDTPVMDTLVQHGSTFSIGQHISVQCYATPCHTQDSVAFFLEDRRGASGDLPKNEIHRAVFTGDTLFISGCGRFFEGTPQEMHHALNTVLAGLPGDTLVYPGHEYTRSNVAFSSGVLPQRQAIQKLVGDLQQKRNGGVTAGVYTIDDEKKHNVFMLVGDDEVQQRVGTVGKGEVETMSVLRELKNAGKMMAKV